MSQGQTIEAVVERGLCTGCGTCVGLCPKGAIELEINRKKGIYLPNLNKQKCDDCGICYQVCPGSEVDFKALNSAIFGRGPLDKLIGNYLNCYIGNATDYNVRFNSASGGLVTALLIFALEDGLIDGALVTKMSDESPLQPQSFIARTREEIISASKSKYCPVPANVPLREILRSKGKYAVVGLPCHLHGIRKAEQLNQELMEKVILHLGIFCSHTPNFWGTELLLRRLKLKKEDVIKIDYRGEGWPGYMKIRLKDTEILLPLPDYWDFVGSDFFTPARCLMCSDQTCELADVSFGDAWLPGLSDKIGKSVTISRTNLGEQFLQKVIAKRVVELNQVTSSEVIRSQMAMLYFKKKNLKARLNLFRRKVLFNSKLLEPDLVDYMLSLFTYFNHLFSQNSALRLLLKRMPKRVISLYRVPFNILSSKKAQGFGNKWIGLVQENKPLKIVIANYDSRLNYGSAALLNTTVDMLGESNRNLKIMVLTSHPEIETELSDVETLPAIGKFVLSKKPVIPRETWQTMFYLLRCSLWQVWQRFFHLDLKVLRNEKRLNEYYSADVIISAGGDVLTEDNGAFSFLSNVNKFLFALLLNKPVILHSESIGPFKRWWIRAIAKFLLNRVKLIILREEISYKYLVGLGIKPPMYVTADSAFLLKPAPKEKAEEILEKEGLKEGDIPLIGISVSKGIFLSGFKEVNSAKEKYPKYIKLVAELTDYLTNAINATVLFIPHVIEPGNDDRPVADDICKLIRNKQKAVSIKNEYTSQETKAIIGQCDLFIGFRMHATIASTSMNVPTICIAYSHKAHGIIGDMLGYERYVIDINKLDYDTLVAAVDDAWANRMEIRNELGSKIDDTKQRALLNGTLFKEFLLNNN